MTKVYYNTTNPNQLVGTKLPSIKNVPLLAFGSIGLTNLAHLTLLASTLGQHKRPIYAIKWNKRTTTRVWTNDHHLKHVHRPMHADVYLPLGEPVVCSTDRTKFNLRSIHSVGRYG
ncbi:uncharacterized protein LOC120424158 [Culex pipiens pallens]|uniref:uncharacterized protein LOC120424158 n=1 Tax=Culex pipiens pallens TaxID=42434 RepID=UPI0019549932|nr:uncharacterized protein LOC120424158 [Culex pipiens pallens]